MAASPETVSMAMFCDFENVALGVRDAKYDKFDIKPVLERLLLKGSIVLKKAYCDWERYKSFKATMHEANFELIEIPHVRQSGKNSADIRMVVDALDLCYTKSHVNTFVIVSGDSDFSPLVSKLRENAKYVIGVGVKQSTSDLLIANCDEFIFYDDLVREIQRSAARRDPKSPQHAAKRSPEEDKKRKDELEARKSQAIELAVATFEALIAERGDSGKIWASMLKEAIKRRKPDFNESYYGFRAFGNLLEEAQARGLLELGRDEKSGAFVSRSSVLHALPLAAGDVPQAGEPFNETASAGEPPTGSEFAGDAVALAPLADAAASVVPAAVASAPKRRSRGGKRQSSTRETRAEHAEVSEAAAAAAEASSPELPATDAAAPDKPAQEAAVRQTPALEVQAQEVQAQEVQAQEVQAQEVQARKRAAARGKPARAAPRRGAAAQPPAVGVDTPAPALSVDNPPVMVDAAPAERPSTAKKPATRGRRPRQPKNGADPV